MIKNLYAVCLLVENLDASLRFYRDALGLSINSQDTGYADFRLADTLLAIFQKDEATIMFPKNYMNTGGGCVLAYRVEDVEKACKELRDKGVKIFEGPKITPWGQSVAYFKDPDIPLQLRFACLSSEYIPIPACRQAGNALFRLRKLQTAVRWV
jgi:catechol 2,3-dioxygenase-like lactoylglutathione lyase family enzyme